ERRDRRADGDAAVPGDLRGDVADPGDVQVPVRTGERQAGRQQPPDQVAVEQRDPPVAAFGQYVGQVPGDGRLAGPGQPGEEQHEPALGPRWPGPAQLTGD